MTHSDNKLAELDVLLKAFMGMESEIKSRVPSKSDLERYLTTAKENNLTKVLLAEVPWSANRLASKLEPERTQVLRQVALMCTELASLMAYAEELGGSLTFHGVDHNDEGEGRSWTTYYLAVTTAPPQSVVPQPLGYA